MVRALIRYDVTSESSTANTIMEFVLSPRSRSSLKSFHRFLECVNEKITGLYQCTEPLSTLSIFSCDQYSTLVMGGELIVILKTLSDSAVEYSAPIYTVVLWARNAEMLE